MFENREIRVTAPTACTAIKVGMYCHLLLNSVITQAQAYLFFPFRKRQLLSPVSPVLSSSNPPNMDKDPSHRFRDDWLIVGP